MQWTNINKVTALEQIDCNDDYYCIEIISVNIASHKSYASIVYA